MTRMGGSEFLQSFDARRPEDGAASECVPEDGDAERCAAKEHLKTPPESAEDSGVLVV